MVATPALPPCDHQPRPWNGPTAAEILAKRRDHLTPTLTHYYAEPIMLVEGHGQYLWDEAGQRYLDAFGGIVTVSVGHCHPRVLARLTEQAQLLQHASNLYLHPAVAEYAEALTATMPGDLSVAYIVNSGSEATDLALLMARLHTGQPDIIALRQAFHGTSAGALGAMGHGGWRYGLEGPGVHHALNPNRYRGPWGYDDPDAGARYAADVADLVSAAVSGRRPAGFIAESIQGVGGVITYPDGYLQRVAEIIHGAGGLMIADEVQSGMARTGRAFWGFSLQGIEPDIVTVAKGIGNGFPMAAVVTRPDIAASLARRSHWNTFGGNALASTVGKAVLDVIQREGLQANAASVGGYLRERLDDIARRHTMVGDIRGEGLMLGVELVLDRATKAPATDLTTAALEETRRRRLLVGRCGEHGNVVRITPPLSITRADADYVADTLDAVMGLLATA